MLEMRTY